MISLPQNGRSRRSALTVIRKRSQGIPVERQADHHGVLIGKARHYSAASQSGGVSMRIFSRIKKEKVLYTLYTADIHTTSGTSICTFADDTTVMATHENPKIAHNMLQQHLLTIKQ